jgi:hypothetical protein
MTEYWNWLYQGGGAEAPRPRLGTTREFLDWAGCEKRVAKVGRNVLTGARNS